MQVGDFHKACVPGAGLFSDGAGGNAKHPPQVKRAGAGAAITKTKWDGDTPTVVTAALAWRTVPGKQTVPRAEAVGAAVVLELAPVNSHQLDVDASYVSKGFGSDDKLAALKRGGNGELWSNIEAARSKHTAVDVQKMPSHLGDSQVLAGKLPLQSYVGNNAHSLHLRGD